MASVQILPSAQNELEDLPETIHVRIHKVLVRLRQFPKVSGAKALRGDLAGQFRVRTGDYRIQFYYDRGSDAVFIVKVGHRDGFYE